MSRCDTIPAHPPLQIEPYLTLMSKLMTQSSFEEITIPLDSLTLAAKVWGPADGYPVIALHGWMDNANSFDRIAPLLPHIRLIALDFAGHGNSDHRPGRMPYYVWEYALDVMDVADALGHETYGLLAHSLGGGVAALVAGLVPEQISRLVLIENVGPVSGDAEDLPNNLLKARQAMQTAARIQQRRLKEQMRRPNPRFTHTDEAVERRLLSPLKLTRMATEMLIERGTRAVPGGYEWSHDQRLALPTAVRMTEGQVQTHIKRITAPTDLILGDEGLFMDEKRAGFMAERLPLFKQLTKHILAGGHHLHMDASAISIAPIVTEAFNTR